MDEIKIRALVDEQAADEGLWFEAETCAEAYVQQALRRLHAVIECDRVDGEQANMDDIANRLQRLGSEESLKWNLRDLGWEAAAEIRRLQAYAKHERSLGAEGPMIELVSAQQEIEQLWKWLDDLYPTVATQARRALERRRE